MRTFESLRELGEYLGRGRVADPRDCSSQTNGGYSECLGEVFRVFDIVRGIKTSKDWHPGLLCRRDSKTALFSMGTDFMKLSYLYMSEYFPIDPTSENGLIKRTGFERSLTEVSLDLLPSLPSLGHLGNYDCQVCKHYTEAHQ